MSTHILPKGVPKINAEILQIKKYALYHSNDTTSKEKFILL